jgi:hypothetical protein
VQIAYPVADAKCDQAIADDLGISEYTPREHMRRSFHKLGVGKRAALVAQRVEGRVATIGQTETDAAALPPSQNRDPNAPSVRPAAGPRGTLSAIGLREAPFSG